MVFFLEASTITRKLMKLMQVYRSSHNERNIRVYFMFYGESVEERRYLSAVRKEKDAFTRLIREKSVIFLNILYELERNPFTHITADNGRDAHRRRPRRCRSSRTISPHSQHPHRRRRPPCCHRRPSPSNRGCPGVPLLSPIPNSRPQHIDPSLHANRRRLHPHLRYLRRA